MNSFNPELELKDTESAIKSKLIEVCSEIRGFRFETELVLMFKKIESKDETKYENFYSSSKVEIIINESDTENVLKSIYTTITSNIKKYLGKVSGWIIDSVVDHNISISKYNSLVGSIYISGIRPSQKKDWLLFKISLVIMNALNDVRSDG